MKRVPAFVTLTLITLVAAVLLALTNHVTRERITAAAQREADAARIAVFANAESFSLLEPPEGVDSLYEAMAGGQAVGHTATVTVQGFAGPVEVMVGMDKAGTLTGISVGGSAFAETAGLGSLAKEPAFTGQFAGKAVPVTLGNGVDAISGATITSKAVVEGINIAAKAMGADVGAAAPTPAPPPAEVPSDPRQAAFPAADSFVETTAPEGLDKLYEAQAGGASLGKVAVATVQGFAGPVEVHVGLDASHVLTGISVGGSAFAETKGFGEKAKDPAFTSQFAGKTVPVTLGDGVDAISGATITSKAVADAINIAAKAMGADVGAAAPTPAPPPAEVPSDPRQAAFPTADSFVEITAPEGVDKLYEAQAGGATLGQVAVVTVQGFAGPVEVHVGMDASHVLTGISVGGSAFAETKNFGEKAKDPAFTSQFAGKTVPVTLGDNIDVIAGATITSSAVQNAVNTAAKAMGAAIEFTLVDTEASATH